MSIVSAYIDKTARKMLSVIWALFNGDNRHMLRL